MEAKQAWGLWVRGPADFGGGGMSEECVGVSTYPPCSFFFSPLEGWIHTILFLNLVVCFILSRQGITI